MFRLTHLDLARGCTGFTIRGKMQKEASQDRHTEFSELLGHAGHGPAVLDTRRSVPAPTYNLWNR
jgi:hypothetical protein